MFLFTIVDNKKPTLTAQAPTALKILAHLHKHLHKHTHTHRYTCASLWPEMIRRPLVGMVWAPRNSLKAVSSWGVNLKQVTCNCSFIFKYLDRHKLPSLDFMHEYYEKAEHLKHLPFSINSPKPFLELMYRKAHLVQRFWI